MFLETRRRSTRDASRARVRVGRRFRHCTRGHAFKGCSHAAEGAAAVDAEQKKSFTPLYQTPPILEPRASPTLTHRRAHA
eukprot:2178938-Pleurochrysis_carterae.AAC.2